MRQFFLLIFFQLLIQTLLFPQNQAYQSDKIIPSSPSAASLGKYGNVPVSFYNGMPNISIPIYNIKTAQNSLNISMQYDASGTRVLQDASWVGLGWSLNAGGVITRTIRQVDDFNQHGFYKTSALPPNDANNNYLSNSNWNYDKTFLDGVYDGTMDAEPDIFSYNFCGYSGRFVLGKAMDGSPVFQDAQNNLQVEYVAATDDWIVTDAEGYKYYFSTTESAQDYYRNALNELQIINGVTGLNKDLNSNPNTSWYLDEIVAPGSEKINFQYVKGKSLSLVTKTEQYYRLTSIDMSPGCADLLPAGLSNDYHTYNASRQELKEVYLKQITFPNGSIEFTNSPRSDIEYLSNYPDLMLPSKLQSIIIKDYSGAVLKKFSFNYSYFHSADKNGRLKLESIEETDKDGNTIPPYSFTYYNPNSVPDKNSKSIDHWGFYNGINNSTLLPTTPIPDGPSSFEGGNRDPNTTANYPVNGVLATITYPTGGSTTFEYELNDYSNLTGDQMYELVDKYAEVRANPSITPGTDVTFTSFTIPPFPDHPDAKIPVQVRCSYQKVNSEATDNPSLGYSNMWLRKTDGGTTYVAGCTTANYDEPNPGMTFTDHNFEPGNYEMSVLSNMNWSYFMSITWKEKKLITTRKGGGIRIMRITDHDKFGNSSVRRFLYAGDDGKSSGILLTNPNYKQFYDVGGESHLIGSGNVISCYFVGHYFGITSNSVFASGLNSRSGIIGYTKVTELSGENGENGKTEYYFHNLPETPGEYPSMPNWADPLNGKLKLVRVFDAHGKLLKETETSYLVKADNSLKALKLFTGAPVADAAYVYKIKFYDNHSTWSVPTTEKETIYDGINKISTAKAYYFDNSIHKELTRLEITKSDASTLITKYKRPDDYTVTGGNSFVEQMRNMHIISPVIEQQTFLKQGATTRLISGTFAKFLKFNNLFFKPSIIYNLETSAPLSDLTESSFASNGQPSFHPNYKPRIYFDIYDPIGNILQQHKSDNVNEVYLWGYNAQYPVAKIVGSDYASAIALVNPILLNNANGQYTDAQMRTELNKLRNGLPNAQVWTYTYAPLKGTTSETDPKGYTSYYEYDDFGRLQDMKDADGNIIKTFEYNYKQ